MKTLNALVAAILAATLPMAPALAQDAAPAGGEDATVQLESDVMAIVTTTDEGGVTSTKLSEPTEFTPGTKLSFGMNYANNGTEPATNVTGTNPLNPAVRLAPDADPALMVSVDGGSTFGPLATLSVATETQGTRPATHADVTHVRWTIASIAPGETGRIAFPVIIR
ncbi:MAG: hypothetical protein AAGA34_03430 [Pseudomonadota bacterium]